MSNSCSVPKIMLESGSTWKRVALLTVPAFVLAGDAVGLLSRDGYASAWFAGLEKPLFMPPQWFFVAGWNAFYALLGIALAMVVVEPRSERRPFALALFFVQLVLSYAWLPIFFLRHDIDLAHWMVFITAALAAVAAGQFLRIRRSSGLLLIPCLVWLIYAAILVSTVAALNPAAASSLSE